MGGMRRIVQDSPRSRESLPLPERRGLSWKRPNPKLRQLAGWACKPSTAFHEDRCVRTAIASSTDCSYGPPPLQRRCGRWKILQRQTFSQGVLKLFRRFKSPKWGDLQSTEKVWPLARTPRENLCRRDIFHLPKCRTRGRYRRMTRFARSGSLGREYGGSALRLPSTTPIAHKGRQ